MNIETTRQKGNIGESIACRYLQNRDFQVMCRNYSKKWGEIDIVCKKDGLIHFVEVKSVTSPTLPNNSSNASNNFTDHRPEDNVHAVKLTHLRRIIETYLWEYYKGHEISFHVHVICVYMNPLLKSARVKMLENIII